MPTFNIRGFPLKPWVFFRNMPFWFSIVRLTILPGISMTLASIFLNASTAGLRWASGSLNSTSQFTGHSRALFMNDLPFNAPATK